MTPSILKPLAIALLLGVAPLSISTAYAVVAATGPAGPAGPTGAKGDQGNQGDQGARGANGTNGTNGANSTVPGPKGDSGTAAIRAIGDSYAGGIVFWVDASGEHGLIAARADQSTGVQWFNGAFKLTGTIGDGGVYAGAMNTALIIAQQTADAPGGNFAAKVAANYSVQENGTSACTGATTEICYGDWYLPSKVELNLLYQQKSVVGGFANSYYWSSSENRSNFAWYQHFGIGDQDGDAKDITLPVRAVRAF
jgi:hypothetical protein